MALTEEQLNTIELSKKQQETNIKMEAIRTSKEILMENDRNKPVGERGISALDIISFAQSIEEYILK